VELATILYPVFVHMYLQLVYNGYETTGIYFILIYFSLIVKQIM